MYNDNDNDNGNGGGGGEWETAPTLQSKKKKKKSSSSANKESRNTRRGAAGGGGGGGQGRGRGGRGGFGGWAKPKPPQPKPNADWPSPPQSHYTSQQSEMLMMNSNAVGSAAAESVAGTSRQNNNSNEKKELTYLDAVPKRELTEPTLASADFLLQQQQQAGANKGGDITTSSTAAASSTFQSMLQKTSLTDLMADYGEEDRDFAKMVISGEQDDSASKPKPKPNKSKQQQQQQRHNERNGVLAPHGRAPIHIELVSYGHHYGVPSEATGKGGYSRSRPLPPFDVRDLDRAPHHVAKLSGLSYHVKRELLNPREIEVEGGEEDSGKGGDTDTAAGKTVQFEADKRSPVRRRTDEVAQDSAAALAEAIEDGYGHASPLDMTVYIGSEYGRHRSVVIVEAAAITLRNMLRKNERNRFGTTPVSVGTRHRDVDRAHRDEEAFGYDLRREAQAAKKQKEREERELEGRW